MGNNDCAAIYIECSDITGSYSDGSPELVKTRVCRLEVWPDRAYLVIFNPEEAATDEDGQPGDRLLDGLKIMAEAEIPIQVMRAAVAAAG